MQPLLVRCAGGEATEWCAAVPSRASAGRVGPVLQQVTERSLVDGAHALRDDGTDAGYGRELLGARARDRIEVAELARERDRRARAHVADPETDEELRQRTRPRRVDRRDELLGRLLADAFQRHEGV